MAGMTSSRVGTRGRGDTGLKVPITSGTRREPTVGQIGNRQSQIGHSPEVSVVMPCLNEVRTVGVCVGKAGRWLDSHGVLGEVIVADNGSTDGSQQTTIGAGARVVSVTAKGYGNALLGGIAAARGRFIIMGDADDSYEFSDLAPFVDKLREGFKLVVGNRFAGGIERGAMPPLHRYFGVPILNALGWLLFQSPCRDFHCGLRGFDRAAIQGLELRCAGMEFASEMIVKATLHHLRIAEVPTTLSPDGRGRRSHLRPWRDGCRHLRFLLGAYIASVVERKRQSSHAALDGPALSGIEGPGGEHVPAQAQAGSVYDP